MATALKMRTPSMSGSIRETGFQPAGAERGTVLPESNLAKSVKNGPTCGSRNSNSETSFFNQYEFGQISYGISVSC